MKYLILSIYDVKAEVYNMPIIIQDKDLEEYKRSFKTELNRPQNKESNFYLYAEDYVFYLLGKIDSESGLVEKSSTILFTLSSLKEVKTDGNVCESIN